MKKGGRGEGGGGRPGKASPWRRRSVAGGAGGEGCEVATGGERGEETLEVFFLIGAETANPGKEGGRTGKIGGGGDAHTNEFSNGDATERSELYLTCEFCLLKR